MKERRGAIELAVSPIVWLVTAAVVLVIVLLLLFAIFRSVDDSLMREAQRLPEPPLPGPQQVITVSHPERIARGEVLGVKVGVYNPESVTLTPAVIIRCSGGYTEEPVRVASAKSILPGGTATFIVLEDIEVGVSPGRALCAASADFGTVGTPLNVRTVLYSTPFTIQVS